MFVVGGGVLEYKYLNSFNCIPRKMLKLNLRREEFLVSWNSRRIFYISLSLPQIALVSESFLWLIKRLKFM
jgi:hypothetical protein